MDTTALRTVTETFASYLSEVTPGDLTAATPCAGWDIDDLYRHVLEENVRFGRAVVSAGDASPAPEAPGRVGITSVHRGLDEDYRRTAAFMELAFAGVVDTTRTCRVPGVPGERTVHDLYEMQLCDTLIHTWDLARATGFAYEPDPGIAQTVLRRLESVPGSARGPGRAFGEIQGSPDPAASVLERIVVLSGRTVGWPAGR